MTVFTVGHSTHELDAFVALVRAHQVAEIVDVRMIPRSRRVPQFNADVLGPALGARGIRYRNLTAIAGRRRPRPDSPNTGWENEGFRGFADHMGTDEFASGVSELLDTARERPVALMCAEGLWWRCHRRLISDALVVRGLEVVHILPAGATEPHRLTEFAVVEGATITYPAVQATLGL